MRIRALIRNLLARDRAERELDDELHAYVEMLEAEKIARGVAPEVARREARIESGGIEAVKEQVREVRMGAAVEQTLQDLQYAARRLRSQPSFTAVSVLTLALGIGATAAIFAVVNAVLLRPLPFASPDALFALEGMSYTGEFVELQRRAQTFDVAAYLPRQATVTGFSEPLRVPAASVSPNLTTLLGVSPAGGRLLRPGDEQDVPVVVISHQFWRTRFGGDPSAVGRSLFVDGVSRTILGIMPPDLAFPALETQLWIPAGVDTGNRVGLWSTSRFMIGRLRPGATLAQADAEVKALAPSMRALFPWSMPADYGSAAGAVPLREALVGDTRPILLMLLGAVGVVLLIAAVNVSNLLVARTLARGHELAIRASLGAARSRLLRQVLTEGAVLVLLGIVAALPMAYAAVQLLARWLPADLPRAVDFAVDVRLFGFGAVLMVVIVLIVGALPALRASRVDLAPRLAESARNSSGRRTRWTSNVLVAAQMALAVALVIMAVLLGRSIGNLYAIAPGFAPDHVVSARISPPSFRFREPAARGALYAAILERLSSMPGVTRLALTDRVPFAGEIFQSVFIIEGRPDPARTGEWPMADVAAIVSPGFFATLAIPVKDGRGFTEADSETAHRVAVVSESLARKYWPAESPVGRRFSFPGDRSGPMTIVGVVGDVKWERVTDEDKGALYLPLAQGSPSAMRVVLRTNGDFESTVREMRSIVQSIDADTPLDQARTMDELVSRSVQGPALAAWLVGCFAAAGLLLGAIGIYGTVSDHVTRRRREIGVRMALGAQRRDVFRSVIAGTLGVVAVGALVGLVAAATVTRLLESMLFGITPTDPPTFAVAAGLLALTAVAAAYLPARRAAAMDPLVVLKVD